MNKIGKFFDLIHNRNWITYLLVGISSTGIYLFVSARYYRAGFPLDDAWIHQTYARNLAQGYGWTFLPGVPSGGATAPLWTVLISMGYLFHISPIIWNSVVGSGLLIGCVHLIRLILINKFGGLNLQWLPILFFFEWHYVWAALSGMETMLTIFLVTLLFFWLDQKFDRGWKYGLFLGICVWVRPDLITLLFPIIIKLLVDAFRLANKGRAFLFARKNIISLTIPLVLLLLCYFSFNHLTSGNWLPTTFYAKQAEYISLRKIHFGIRYWEFIKTTWVGIGSLLIPGYIYGIVKAIQTHDDVTLSFAAWFFLYIGIYALNLPVTYQHGRYLLPALAAYYLIGIRGAGSWWAKNADPVQQMWIIHTAWKGALGLVAIAFYGLGALAYAKDVAFVESQMVDTALWINANTPITSKIALHDIGAMGYFGKRDLVDLAGLIDPAVIPFIRDEARLAQYIDQKKVDFLVCFPDWYPRLTADLTILYQADERFNIDINLGPMTVYQWPQGQLTVP